MGGHVLQHVRGRLKGLLTNLVQADRVPALFAGHGSARNSSDGYVHATQHTLVSRPVPSSAERIGTATHEYYPLLTDDPCARTSHALPPVRLPKATRRTPSKMVCSAP
jgi:hypothetical protein